MAAVTERKQAAHVYFAMTRGLCGLCHAAIDVKILFRDDAVWFEKFCPDHGNQRVLVSSSIEWYLDCLSFLAPSVPPKRAPKPVERGCPFDCGACVSHQQRLSLPLVPLHVREPAGGDHAHARGARALSRDELADILRHLVADGSDLDELVFTSGEHPELPEFLQMCREAGIGRPVVATDGVGLHDEVYLARLAALDARVTLRLDDRAPDTDALLDLLGEHGVSTTLRPTRTPADASMGRLLEGLIGRAHLRSLELETPAGQPADRRTSGRITVPDLQATIERATAGRIGPKDFVPSPLAHVHCYSICPVLCLDDGDFVPFTRFMTRAGLFALLQDSTYIEPRAKLQAALRTAIDTLRGEAAPLAANETVLRTLECLEREVYPTEDTTRLPARRLSDRQRLIERRVKFIIIHAHMDADDFDVSRIMKCSVGLPGPDGSSLPLCVHNVLGET